MKELFHKRVFIIFIAMSFLLATGCSYKYCGSFTADKKEISREKVPAGIHSYRVMNIKSTEVTESGIKAEIAENKTVYQKYNIEGHFEAFNYKVYASPTPVVLQLSLMTFLLFGIGILLGIGLGIGHETTKNGLVYKYAKASAVRDSETAINNPYREKNFPEEYHHNISEFYVKAIRETDKIKSKETIDVEYEFKSNTNDIPATDVKTIIYPADFIENDNCVTDEKGIASFSFRKLPYNMAFSETELEKKMKSSSLMSQIKKPYRDDLLELFIKWINSTTTTLTIETKAEPVASVIKQSQTKKEGKKPAIKTGAENAKKQVDISLFTIDEKKIYERLKQLIDKEINSKIATAKIVIEDDNSHIEKSDVRMEMNFEAPSKAELAAKYFSGNLRAWAEKQIKDYTIGEIKRITDSDGSVTLQVYVPSIMKFETKHKAYHAYQDETTFERGKLDKTIRLIDIGQKLRLENVEKKGGTITDK